MFKYIMLFFLIYVVKHFGRGTGRKIEEELEEECKNILQRFPIEGFNWSFQSEILQNRVNEGVNNDQK